MNGKAIYVLFLLIFMLIFATQTLSDAADYIPGQLRSYATIHSIGIEWDITGDNNNNATAMVQYRRQGSNEWKQALPLFRVDYRGYDMLAGSILFLEPGTEYEVKIDVSDPDGGTDSRLTIVNTRPLPAIPTGGRTFHVVPGSGSGDGSQSNPFKGISAAQSVAQPGDIFLLHAGKYASSVVFDNAGTPGNYIVWKSAGDGEAVFNGISITASHVWIEGIKNIATGNGMTASNSPQDVVIIKNTLINCHYCIKLITSAKDWYIADNTIIGDTLPESGSKSGEGIELAHSGGHTVAYNSITHVADGVSYPTSNVDIFGNDIFDTSDDGIEPDGGYFNIRIWNNRLHNNGHHAISFQGMEGELWYVIRNQIIGTRQALKLRDDGRFVFLHNTIVGPPYVQQIGTGFILASYSRNNLWVAVDGTIWHEGSGLPTWKTDVDYDGFDWGNGQWAFKWNNIKYPDLSSFSSAIGVETNGIRVNKDNCFESLNYNGTKLIPVPPQHLTLKPSCEGIDYGVVLPNINDDFTGNAPDLGAYELGAALPQYGPRTGQVPPPTYQCSDNIDNDGDGFIDYPQDQGCTSSKDNDESNSTSDTTQPSPPSNLRKQ